MTRPGNCLPKWLKWVITIGTFIALAVGVYKSTLDGARAAHAAEQCLKEHPPTEQRKP